MSVDPPVQPAFGVDLGRLRPSLWLDAALAADRLGYESVWIPEHLVFPAAMSGSPIAGHTHPPVAPTTPTFDAFVTLAAIAARTSRLRLGTNVYNIGLRHPFVTARAVATLDIISAGRVEFGVGASWLAEEWAAVGLDFSSRGPRIDQSIDICRRLWSETLVEHHSEIFDFPAVYFEPKPVQARIPIHIGGDSRAALRRVAALGDGWIGMVHDPVSYAAAVAHLDRLCSAASRSLASVQRSALVPRPDGADVDRWAAAGATRLIVAPWPRSESAVEGLEVFAATFGLQPA